MLHKRVRTADARALCETYSARGVVVLVVTDDHRGVLTASDGDSRADGRDMARLADALAGAIETGEFKTWSTRRRSG